MSIRPQPPPPLSEAGLGWRLAALLLPALLLVGLLFQPASFLPPWLATSLAFTLLLVYPGYLLRGLLTRRWAFARSTPADAFALSFGLWSVPAALLQLAGASLQALLLTCAATTALLAAAALLAIRRGRSSVARPRPRPGASRAFWWAGHVFFWGGAVMAVALFARYASIWRPSDRWDYQRVVLLLLDTHSLSLPAQIAGIPAPVRLEVSPWLPLVAAVQQLSAAPVDDLYSFFLPPILLFLAVCAAFGLGRQVLNSRWAAGLAAALLVLYWLGDIALPGMAHFSWQERMLLRLDGGQSTLGQWALLGRIVEDKFLLIFVVLPPVQAALLRYLYRGSWRAALLWGVMVVGAALLHPLGVVFAGFSFGAVAPFLLIRRRRRAYLGRLAITAALLGVLALIPLLQRQQVLSDGPIATFFAQGGQAVIDLLPQYGMWVSPASDTVFALHPYVIGRREMLVLALLLLPILLLVRRLRRPGLQFVTGLFVLCALLAFNPLAAPLLARAITFVMLFRAYWIIVLPAVLILALAVQTATSALSRRRLSVRARRGLAFAPALLLLLLAAVLWPKIGAGLDLLGQIQAGSLRADERAALHWLRAEIPPGSTVLAPEWLSDELPGAVGHSASIVFRSWTVDDDAYPALHEIYLTDDPRASRLSLLDRYGVDYVVAPLRSPIDLQLAELAPAAELLYDEGQQRIYHLSGGWQQAPLPAALLAAQAALDGRDYAQAVSLAEEALRLAPGGVSAAQIAVLAHQWRGEHAAAVAAAERARQAHPDAEPVRLLAADAYVGQGFALAGQGRGAEAAAAYRQALAIQPDHLGAARMLASLHAAGGIHLGQEESDRIMAVFHAAAYGEPERPADERRRSLWALADIGEDLGRSGEAEQALRDALALSRAGDGEAEAAAHLGRFYVRTGEPAQAQALYAWAIRRNGAAEAIYSAAAELAAQAYGPDAAIVLYLAAASANPLAAWPHVRLAALHWEQEGGAAAALAELQQAQARDGANQDAWQLAAEIHADAGDEDAVRRTWEAAAAANEQATWPLLALAAAAREEGDSAGALAALRRAAALAPADAQLAVQVEEAARALDRQRRAEHAWQALPGRSAAARFVPLDLPAPAAAVPDPVANPAADPAAGSATQGWTLVGYGADQAALLAGGQTPLWLFWAAPEPAAEPGLESGSAAAGWRRIDATLWVQSAVVANLVAGGNFEGGALPAGVADLLGVPSAAGGFPQDDFSADPAARQVVTVARGGVTTQAAVLASGPANPSTSFVSPPIPVEEGKLYLQSGALRSAGGSGYLGRNWLLGDGAVQEEYLFAGEESGFWRAGSALVEPPPGAVSVQVRLLNRNATGRVCFDDILFLALDRPG